MRVNERDRTYLGLLEIHIDSREHRQRERGRLARPRLRLSDHVARPVIESVSPSHRVRLTDSEGATAAPAPGSWTASDSPSCTRPSADLGACQRCISVSSWSEEGHFKTHKLRSSNDLTEKSGELGSCCWSARVTYGAASQPGPARGMTLTWTSCSDSSSSEAGAGVSAARGRLAGRTDR